MPLSRANGVDVWYEVSGEGPPLVLVHANPFDHDMFMYQRARFATWFRVIAVDIRSYGRSARIETPFTIDDMVADVMGVIHDERAEDAIILGVSVGSRIVMKMGIDRTDEIAAIVAVGSGSESRGANFDRRIKGYEGPDLPRYHAEHLRSLVSPAFAESPRGQHLLKIFSERDPTLSGKAIAQGFRALAVSDVTDDCRTLDLPVLVINGELDNALPRGRAMAELLPRGRHVMIPGAGHACCLEDPVAVDTAVLDFLRAEKLMPAL
ncbi:MAG: alpha/beta fold hydrolase [Alphaproteobacteria bacterium]